MYNPVSILCPFSSKHNNSNNKNKLKVTLVVTCWKSISYQIVTLFSFILAKYGIIMIIAYFVMNSKIWFMLKPRHYILLVIKIHWTYITSHILSDNYHSLWIIFSCITCCSSFKPRRWGVDVEKLENSISSSVILCVLLLRQFLWSENKIMKQ